VNVIEHSAVAEDGDAMVTGIVLEQLEVEPVVFGPEIVLLAAVPALGDAVGNACESQARQSRHIAIVANYPQEFSGVV